MYLKFEEVLMVHPDKRQKLFREEDPVVYVRDMHAGPNIGERVLTTDPKPARDVGDAVPYGRIYYSAAGHPCVIPDEYDEHDANLAKDVVQ